MTDRKRPEFSGRFFAAKKIPSPLPFGGRGGGIYRWKRLHLEGSPWTDPSDGACWPGGISRAFAASLALLPDARRVAVGSRSAERAADFAKVYGFERAWGGYEQLAEDPEVDVVYIASPHPMHFWQAMLCMDHGKSVLIEKTH